MFVCFFYLNCYRVHPDGAGPAARNRRGAAQCKQGGGDQKPQERDRHPQEADCWSGLFFFIATKQNGTI